MKVEMRPAFAWDCHFCGREVFTRGIVPELSEEELEELREDQEIEPGDEGDFLMMPTEVECPHCHSRFETEHYGYENL